eukprot:gene12545-16824_t
MIPPPAENNQPTINIGKPPLVPMLGSLPTGQQLTAEVEEGNREYKFKLTNLSQEQLKHRITQLHWRLNEGNGIAFYLIGVEDNGNQLGLTDADLEESLGNLRYMAQQAGCDMSIKQLFSGSQGITAEVQMKRRERLTLNVEQLSVAIAGDLNTGKSTLIGVLLSGKLDNGKGLARAQVFTHNHEIESGRTSCISHHILHFNQEGQVLNSDTNASNSGKSNRLRTLSELELADESFRIINLIDLAGHPKYLKTTLHGLIGRQPDYAIICISAKTGLQPTTLEHIGICVHLMVPIILVITKIDCFTSKNNTNNFPSNSSKSKKEKTKEKIYSDSTEIESNDVNNSNQFDPTSSESELNRLVNDVKSALKSSSRLPVWIESIEDLAQLLLNDKEGLKSSVSDKWQEYQNDNNSSTSGIIPIFTLSNITGQNLDLLRAYLFQLQLPSRNKEVSKKKEDVEVRIFGSMALSEEETKVIQGSGVISGGGSSYPRWRSYNQREQTASRNNFKSSQNNSKDTISISNNSSNNDILDSPSNNDILDSPMNYFKSNNKLFSNNSINNSDNNSNDMSVSNNGSNSPMNMNDDTYFIGCDPVNIGASLNTNGIANKLTTTIPNRSRSSEVRLEEFSDLVNATNNKVFIGYIQSGIINVSDSLLLGPSRTGAFLDVIISSIRINNVPIRFASPGQTVTLKIVADLTPRIYITPQQANLPEPLANNPNSQVNQEINNNENENNDISSLRNDSFTTNINSDENIPSKQSILSQNEINTDTIMNMKSMQITPNDKYDKESQYKKRRQSAIGLVLLPNPRIPVILHSSHNDNNNVDDQSDNDRQIISLIIPMPRAYFEFIAELLLLNHPTKVGVNYQPVVHVGCVKQSAKIVALYQMRNNRNVANDDNNDNSSSSSWVNDDTWISNLEEIELIACGEKALC